MMNKGLSMRFLVLEKQVNKSFGTLNLWGNCGY